MKSNRIDNNLIEFDNKKKEFILETINIPINGEIIRYIFIFEKSSNNVSIFSDFFYDQFKGFCLINKSYNTKKNFYANYIVRFLNFIYNESDNKIDNIENLKLDMVSEFLNKFSKSKLNGDNLETWRSSTTVKKANHAIKYFVYWLWIKKDRDSKKKIFKMKYINSDDFTFTQKQRINKQRSYYKAEYALNDIAPYEISRNNNSRIKVTNLSMYGIHKLLELTESQEPMLTFAIALGAFAGLRAGTVLQMSRSNLHGFENEYSMGCWIDLSKEHILRSDGKVTGNIKCKKSLEVHDAFTEILRYFYKKHINYLAYNKLNNKYGALFLNKNGIALKDKHYYKKFRKLRDLLLITITEEAKCGNIRALKEKEILESGPLTHHSLRYFFSQFIDELEDGNEFNVALFRGDSNNNSQKVYLKGHTEEKIRRVQEKIWDEIINGGIK